MSDPTDGRAPARTTVEFPAREGYRGVATLVLGGVAARFELPVDRVDDLLLGVDSLLMQGVLGEVARIEATASAKNTTGIVMASELMNDSPRVSAVPPEVSAAR